MEISNVPSGDEWWHWAFVVLMRALCVSKKECIKFQAPLVPQYPTKILNFTWQLVTITGMRTMLWST